MELRKDYCNAIKLRLKKFTMQLPEMSKNNKFKYASKTPASRGEEFCKPELSFPNPGRLSENQRIASKTPA